MRGYLLDTSTALFAASSVERLSKATRAAIGRGPAFLSVVSYWEVVVKSMKGRLDVGDPRQWWRETLDTLGLTPLLLRPEHVAEIRNLPAHHADPFDRVLVAQATVEDFALLTPDTAIALYAGARLVVIH